MADLLRSPALHRTFGRTSELVSLQEDYRAWLDSLPVNLADSNTAEALRAVCEIDLSDLESVDPPRGFGRD
jgi:hypothetical protein